MKGIIRKRHVTSSYQFDHNAYAAALQANYAHLSDGEESGVSVRVAGRLMLLRRQGKLAFATMRDSSGEIQLFALAGVADEFEAFTKLHLGDWVGVEGEVVRTKRGELSVKVTTWVRLAEALHNFGDKWAGIADFDLRYRHREADLWANELSRRSLLRRSAAVRSMRERCWGQGFVEVETPILNAIPSGAYAKPFVTHHNALDTDFYLRIAPELWLKRLVVGGFERVFEIGRLFRNEGVSPRHNPEFTSIEIYAAYWDYEDMMSFTEELVAGVALDVLGTTEIEYQGRQLSLSTPWARRPMAELASEAVGEEVSANTPRERLAHLLDERGVAAHASWGPGRCLAELFEATSEDNLWDAVFVTGHPVETSPLARRDPHDELITQRFESYAAGRELSNGFSELTDPREQRARFEDQARLAAAGDDEAMVLDEDFLRALEWGLPPTAGMGMGIDRLAMLLADEANIREVIAFPTLKPLRD
ncbi:MAG: lysine--tRNA ligase [Actinobacteria bacterium 21-64-8]|nr:MAG: lysine--tRNA ligase [Actinobacteria bacterium 21-64-8]